MSKQAPATKRAHLRLLRDAGLTLAGAAVRRLRSGPPHASWPWFYEFVSTFMRTAATGHTPVATAWTRAQIAPLPFELRRKFRHAISELGGLKAEHYAPRETTGTTVLYLHGGGYVTCSPASHRDTIARVMHVTGADVFAPYYRLAPENPHPAALEDALAAYRALLRRGVSPDRLFIGGDSAGGGLTLALLLRLRDQGEPLPRGAFLFSPWVDLALSFEQLDDVAPLDYLDATNLVTFAREYAGARPLTDPYVSPIYGDLSGLPPLLVITGELEILNEQNERLVARARAAGVEVEHEVAPGMLHAFACFAALVPAGRAALASVGAFVRAQAARPPRDLYVSADQESADVA